MEFKQQIDAESSFLEMMAFSFSNFVAEKTQNPEPTKSLTCPRCDSSNTKFCYYNNYKLTQPRHFCKSCKRYWTRGGSLRVVPIGGGCRKNKKSKHDSKAERQPGACNRGECVEDRRKKIVSTSAATTTSSGNNSCMTNATVFSSSESSGSDAKLAKNVIEICASPGKEDELVDLPSHVAKVRIPQSGSSTTSGVLFTVCTPKEQGAGVSFHEQQISRNPVISVVNTHKLKSKSNSLFLGRQDFSSSDPLVLDNTNPYFTDSTSLDAALLAAANFSNSQWLDQIAIHNNETGYASQIVGKPIHSKCTFSPVSQVENIFLPSVGTDLINCSEPHWRIQSNRCQQVLLASLAHADHLVETSKSDVGNTIPERQWGSGGFSSCEPCYMQDDAGVLNHFHPFDVKSGF